MLTKRTPPPSPKGKLNQSLSDPDLASSFIKTSTFGDNYLTGRGKRPRVDNSPNDKINQPLPVIQRI